MISLRVAIGLMVFGLARVLGAQAEAHPSVVSRVLATHRPSLAAEATPESMAAAGKAFLASLDAPRRARAALAVDSPERQKWTNVPPRADDGGLRLGDCEESQVQRACDLLAAVLSRQGYEKVRDVMLADDRLLPPGGKRAGFGAENFWIIVFGQPSETDLWAIQLDGHHLALNLTMRGDRMALSPTFIGTQPAVFRSGTLEIAPLRGAVDQAFAFLSALSEEQRAAAIVGPRRGQIVEGAGRDGFIAPPEGLSVKHLAAEQKTLLLGLVRQYVGDLPEPHAARRMEILTKELDAMTFSWRGPVAAGDVSYRIQGPSLIISYACQDLGGDPLQHIHAIYRDPTNEYGVALTR